MELCNLSEVQNLLKRHGFHFSKSMGQNFLIRPQVPVDIAEASGADPTTAVLEIGPGIGPLTVQLAKRAGKVVAVELDKALFPVLVETLSGFDNTEVVPGDILKLDLPSLISDKFQDFTPIVCANLPYNITSPVLTKLLESGYFAAITVMIQREVAKRICAAPGTADYGAFSVFCQYHARCEYLFEVPPDCFYPAPKVTSAVVKLIPQPKPDCVDDSKAFFAVVKAAFAQRRKTLLNCLGSAYGDRFSKEELRQIITACGLPEDIRGERLGISEFAALAKQLSEQYFN